MRGSPGAWLPSPPACVVVVTGGGGAGARGGRRRAAQAGAPPPAGRRGDAPRPAARIRLWRQRRWAGAVVGAPRGAAQALAGPGRVCTQTAARAPDRDVSCMATCCPSHAGPGNGAAGCCPKSARTQMIHRADAAQALAGPGHTPAAAAPPAGGRRRRRRGALRLRLARGGGGGAAGVHGHRGLRHERLSVRRRLGSCARASSGCAGPGRTCHVPAAAAAPLRLCLVRRGAGVPACVTLLTDPASLRT
jgi:hypothetical protein